MYVTHTVDVGQQAQNQGLERANALGTLRVARGGQALMLTPIGLKLLTVLMRASPRVVTRQQLEREVWGDLLPDSDTLRSHLYSLRKAIDKPFEHALLHTIAGAGYRLSDDDGR